MEKEKRIKQLKCITYALVTFFILSFLAFAQIGIIKANAGSRMKKGWWYVDENGNYPCSKWQKINNTWYYFDADGYMAANEWVDGCWCGADGANSYEGIGSWSHDSNGWWFEDSLGWYPTASWQRINGNWYYFGADGYLLTDCYVGNYWVNSRGVWEESWN
ncbi:MAG: hypothetical protein J5929_02305 [Eubacterium sp.]|nr:hypothetical protein [Eubacterium sp.]